jgi:hypothetical protein
MVRIDAGIDLVGHSNTVIRTPYAVYHTNRFQMRTGYLKAGMPLAGAGDR